jgi:hypothetical protein
MLRLMRHGFRSLSLVLVFVVCAALPMQRLAAEAYRFADVARVVAVGDIHGALDEFVSILQGTGLVDEALNWRGGESHLVAVGDLLDRGDFGRQVMELLMRLEDEAAEAGGAVHVVLGNHEVMNLTGDLRYVSEGDYAQFGSEARQGLPAGYLERRAAFAPDGRYGRWLLELPVAIVIDDTLFVHGGISAILDGLSLDEINASSRRDIRRFAEGWHILLEAGELADGSGFDAILARASALNRRGVAAELRQAASAIVEAYEGLPFVPDGPLWYRGNARCHPYLETDVAAGILRQLGARRVAVGHTPTEERRITSRLEGRVLRLDTGMNAAAYQGRPAALIIENGEARAWYAGEGQADIEAEPIRIWDRPHGMSDAEIEEFLAVAEPTRMEKLEGSNGSRRLLTLVQNDRRLNAIFTTGDSAPRLPEGRWTRRLEGADRYVHEVAAYRLDRLLDLHMVPVTVERMLDGETGALRLLVEPGFFEQERQQREIPFTGHCDLQAQYELMGLFDVLIFNAGPQLGLLRYDRYWMAWLMDQSRAFATSRDINPILRRSGVSPSPQLAEALARITPERVEFLAEHLHERQVQAVVDRAARLRSAR